MRKITITQTWSTWILVCLCALTTVGHASELDILAGSARGLKPNVVMVMDTSDSLSGFATDANFGTSTLSNLTVCEAGDSNCRLSQFIASYTNQFSYLNTSSGFKQIKASVSSGELDTMNLNFVPKMDFINDLIREGVYQSHVRGGFNLSILAGAKNNDGLRSGSQPVRLAGSISPADASDNGAFVLFGFRDTESLSAVDALVNNIYAFTGHDQRSNSGLLQNRGNNNIWIEDGEFGVIESLHESAHLFSGQASPWQKSNWELLQDLQPHRNWIDASASGGNVNGPYLNQWNNVPLNCNTTNHTVIYADDTPAWDWQANTLVQNQIASLAPPVAPPSANSSATHDTSSSHTLLDEYVSFLATTDLSSTAVGPQYIHTHFMSFEGGSVTVTIPPPPDDEPPPPTGVACLDCSTGTLVVDPSCPGGWKESGRILYQDSVPLDCPFEGPGPCSCNGKGGETLHELVKTEPIETSGMKNITKKMIMLSNRYKGQDCLDIDDSGAVIMRETDSKCPKWQLDGGVFKSDITITGDPPPPPDDEPTPVVNASLDQSASSFYSSMVSNTDGVHVSISDYKTMTQAQGRVFDNIMSIHNAHTILTGYRITRPPSAANPLLLGNDVYVSFYNRENGWVGNIKHYKMVGGTIQDANDQPAFDTDGHLIPNSKDFWNNSGSADGDSVRKGGLASRLNPNAGNRFVQDGRSRIAINNAGLSPDLLNYALGKDDTGANANRLWDALNGEPVVFHYRRGNAGTISRLFTANNGGFLHAFDPTNGTESWAIMPKPLLANLANLKARTGDKIYGLDGGITLWHDDLNGDRDLLDASGSVDTDPASSSNRETLMVFATAHRGGSLIAAIDATDPNSPDPAWLVSDATSGFSGLGQTWAKPVLAHLEEGSNGDRRAVLIISGGYDSQYDDPSYRDTAAKGAGLYIVDALTGTKIWAAGQDGENVANMNYSFVSAARPYDTDADGTLDLFYAMDIMGQIFRCDIADLPSGATSLPSNSSIDCGLVIQLDKTKTRRFYSDLDSIVTTNKVGMLSNVALSVGSGNLTNPLEDPGYKDRFYVVFDDAISSATPTHANENEEILKDINTWASNPSPSAGVYGYYLELDRNEKVLSRASTHQYRLTFQSYSPTASPDCRKTPLDGRIYAFNILDASPASINRNAGLYQAVTVPTGLPQANLVHYNYDTTGKLDIEICAGGSNACLGLPQVDATQVSYMSDDE